MLHIILISIIILFIIANRAKSKPKIQKFQRQIERENEIIGIINQAINNGKKLYIGYKSSYGYSGEEYTERVVIPKTVSLGSELNQTSPLKEGEWIDEDYYMFAYCELRDEERHFRLDRIQSIKII